MMQHLPCRDQFLLRDTLRLTVRCHDLLQCLQTDLCPKMHQTVIDKLDIRRIGDVKGLLHDDAPRINILIEEEGRDTCLSLSIDNSPVDGSCPTILRQQGGMYIKCSVLRHVPHHFRQHSEGHHHLEVGLV